MIITKTPYRVSFFGGGTDYNSWFEPNGGLIIGTSIAKYNYISVRKLPPFFDYHSRIVYSKTEEVSNNMDIDHPSVRNCLRYMDIKDGLEIHYDGDIPARSGIGSSSSFTVGFLHALHAYKRKMVSKSELAEQAIFVEQKLSEENVGIQDQILASHGGINIIDMGPGDTYKVTPLVMSKDFVNYFEKHVMLAFSGQTRISSNSAGKQIKRIDNGELKDQMSNIHEIAKSALDEFRKESDLDQFGNLLDKTWQIKKTLTEDLSCSKISNTYDAAIKAGAFGGRLLGAGSGGFLMFLAPPEKHEQIKRELAQSVKVWVPFKFDRLGSHVIMYNGDE